MNHPEFPVVTFLTALLLLFPLPFHAKSGNVAMFLLAVWLLLVNIVYGVDAVLFAGTVLPKALVWCDISGRIILGSTVALPAACLCICVHLEHIASIRSVGTTIASRRRRQYAEAGACLLFPCIFMALHYIVQGHRFDIIEDFGCRPATYTSLPAVFLVWVLPLCIAVATLIFACIAFAHFIRRRVSFARHIESRSALTTKKYMRLILMAVILMLWTVGVTAFTLAINIPAIRPWTNWDDVHSDFSRIGQFPLAFLPSAAVNTQLILWWLIPTSAWIFLAFLLSGQEFLGICRLCISWIKRHVSTIRSDPLKVVKLPSYAQSCPLSDEPFKNLPSRPFAEDKHTLKCLPVAELQDPRDKNISSATSTFAWSDAASLYTSSAADSSLNTPTSPHHSDFPSDPPQLSFGPEKFPNSVV